MFSTVLNDNYNKVVEAFKAWEDEYRKDPTSFLTPEECEKMEVADVSERRAIAFIAYVRQRED